MVGQGGPQDGLRDLQLEARPLLRQRPGLRVYGSPAATCGAASPPGSGSFPPRRPVSWTARPAFRTEPRP